MCVKKIRNQRDCTGDRGDNKIRVWCVILAGELELLPTSVDVPLSGVVVVDLLMEREK